MGIPGSDARRMRAGFIFNLNCTVSAAAAMAIVAFLPVVLAATPLHAAPVPSLGAGYSHSCAVTAAGRLKCWGSNSSGEVGDGTWGDRLNAVDVVGLGSGVRSVSLGTNYSCALTASGGVQCWGANYSGALGDGTHNDHEIAADVTGLTAGVAAISAGFGHVCALTSAGGVKCWGSGEYGQLGNGSTTQRLTAVDVQGLVSGVAAVSAGGLHTCAVTISGGVKCWGYNGAGMLGDGTTTQSTTPVDVVGLGSGAEAVFAGQNRSCATVAGGALKCWGSGQLVPTAAAGLGEGVVAVAMGESHQCALMASHKVACWGDNSVGQMGDGTTMFRDEPVAVSGLSARIIEIAASGNHTCAKADDGLIRCWGENLYGELGDGSATRYAEPVDVVAPAVQFIQIATGFRHTCALTATGSVQCWGSNDSGALGDGTWDQRPLPTHVLGFHMPDGPVVDIVAGFNFGCAVTDAGRVKCWGNPDVAGHPIATDVPGLQLDISQVVAGSQSQHACAITAAGALKCWGRNSEGQLGDGSTIDQASAVDVTGLGSGVASATTGGVHTCVVTDAGAVKCWGRNDSGQLGDGTTVSHMTPGDVVGMDSGVTQISAGRDYTCALMANGGAKCWGGNAFGKLGDGSQQPQLQPVEVIGFGGFNEKLVAIAAGDVHTCAVTTTGAARCWGFNFYGQLGSGDYESHQATITDVVGLNAGVVGISAAFEHTCAITGNGAAKCWGHNQNGQLGNGEAGSLAPRTVIGSPFDDTLFGDGFDA